MGNENTVDNVVQAVGTPLSIYADRVKNDIAINRGFENWSLLLLNGDKEVEKCIDELINRCAMIIQQVGYDQALKELTLEDLTLEGIGLFLRTQTT